MEYKKCSVLREGNVTTSGSSNRELATNGDRVDGITLLKRHLATATAERDDLASDIVRLKAHLEAAEKSAKAWEYQSNIYSEWLERSEARAKVMREALEVICALVMKYDIPAAWEAREIAQKALQEATND